MDVKKRTEKMLAEARKKFLIHESLSRDENRKEIPLKYKLRVALPLTAIVLSLYMWSFAYTKNRHGKRFEKSQPPNVSTSVREISLPENQDPIILEPSSDIESDMSIEDLHKKW